MGHPKYVDNQGLSMKDGGVVDLWWTPLDADFTQAQLDACAAMLDPAERAQWQRIQRPERQRQHLLSKALLRIVLGKLLGVAPNTLRFGTAPRGKPYLDKAQSALPNSTPILHFNLSHTGGLALLATSFTHEVGVDTEHTGRAPRLVIADRYFSDSEARALRAVYEPHEQAQHFWRLWTLKEAYAKAMGEGLSHELLEQARFDDLSLTQLRAYQCPYSPSEPATRYALWMPTPDHIAALHVRNAPEHEPPALRQYQVLPGQNPYCAPTLIRLAEPLL